MLRHDSSFAKTLLTSQYNFFICDFAVVKLFKRKERLVTPSRLSETDAIRFYYSLLQNLTVYEALIPLRIRQQAHTLCADIDEADTPHVALALHLNASLWTGDKKLQTGLRRKGFETFFVPF